MKKQTLQTVCVGIAIAVLLAPVVLTAALLRLLGVPAGLALSGSVVGGLGLLVLAALAVMAWQSRQQVLDAITAKLRPVVRRVTAALTPRPAHPVPLLRPGFCDAQTLFVGVLVGVVLLAAVELYRAEQATHPATAEPVQTQPSTAEPERVRIPGPHIPTDAYPLDAVVLSPTPRTAPALDLTEPDATPPAVDEDAALTLTPDTAFATFAVDGATEPRPQAPRSLLLATAPPQDTMPVLTLLGERAQLPALSLPTLACPAPLTRTPATSSPVTNEKANRLSLPDHGHADTTTAALAAALAVVATRVRKPVKPVKGSCSWLLQPGSGKNPHPGILSINGVPYAFEEVTDGLQLLGYRLTRKGDKPGTTVCYDIDTHSDPQHWRCECPDYEYRRAHRDPKGCKHCAGLKAALAFMGWPLSQPQPPTPAPLEPGETLPDAGGVDGDPAAYARY